MRDTHAVVGTALPLALLFTLVSLLLDTLYPFLDPRLRIRKGGVA
jgi:ABC-type dipeptide/oligopeptide/nickel transport system permease component